jgi:hypothetical protein
MATGPGLPVDINKPKGNKNHAPRGVSGRDGGVAGEYLVMFIYLATVTSLRTLAFPVYCPQVHLGLQYVDTLIK